MVTFGLGQTWIDYKFYHLSSTSPSKINNEIRIIKCSVHAVLGLVLFNLSNDA